MDETIRDRLLVPDILLPMQYVAAFCQQGVTKSGEHRLLYAVLEDAVLCFQKYAAPKSSRERRLFREAEQWLMREDDTRPDPVADEAQAQVNCAYFTCEQVCDVLGINAEYVRAGLRRWREQLLRKAA